MSEPRESSAFKTKELPAGATTGSGSNLNPACSPVGLATAPPAARSDVGLAGAGYVDSNRAARITRRRLDPNIFEETFTQDAAVRDAVERDTAGHAQTL